MEREYCDTAILGATFLGMGAALNLDDCAVIESGGLFGAEFVNNYKINRPGQIVVKTKPGIAFLKELRDRGLVHEDGEIYQAPAVYVLSKFLKEKPLDIRLMTETIAVEKREGGYDISLYNMNGSSRIQAKRVIDTTILGRGRQRPWPVEVEKNLNAVMFNPRGAALDALVHNRISGLYVYSLPAPRELSRHEAVERLCALEGVFAGKGMRIASIAPEFSYTLRPFAEYTGENFLWQPSMGYANLIAAFDEGAALAERIGAGDFM
jgi:hypothetical protein